MIVEATEKCGHRFPLKPIFTFFSGICKEPPSFFNRKLLDSLQKTIPLSIFWCRSYNKTWCDQHKLTSFVTIFHLLSTSSHCLGISASELQFFILITHQLQLITSTHHTHFCITAKTQRDKRIYIMNLHQFLKRLLLENGAESIAIVSDNAKSPPRLSLEQRQINRNGELRAKDEPLYHFADSEYSSRRHRARSFVDHHSRIIARAVRTLEEQAILQAPAIEGVYKETFLQLQRGTRSSSAPKYLSASSYPERSIVSPALKLRRAASDERLW